jgi:DNA invertase Pin-like site-specific DNA recombinase
MRTLMVKLGCGVWCYAKMARELIRARTGEGTKRAQARGVRFGRQTRFSDLAAGEIKVDIARSYNVDATAIGPLQ